MSKKVKLGLRKLDTALKLAKAKEIISCMRNNPLFPEPDPGLEILESLIHNVDEKFTSAAACREEMRILTSELNTLENQLDKMLSQLAVYVESKAKGDILVIKSAGMDVKADSKPIGLPGEVKVKYIRETMNNGELKVSWEKVRGAKVYNIELAGKKGSGWQLYDSTTKTKSLIERLESGTKYSIRIQAIGSAGKGPYSETVSKFAP